MPGTVPSRGKLCTSLRYLVYSCARRRAIETHRSRNNNRRAYLNNVFFDLANSTRLIPVTIEEDRKALYIVLSTEKKKFIYFYSYFNRELRYIFQAEGWLVEARESARGEIYYPQSSVHESFRSNCQRRACRITNSKRFHSFNISLDVFSSYHGNASHPTTIKFRSS